MKQNLPVNDVVLAENNLWYKEMISKGHVPLLNEDGQLDFHTGHDGDGMEHEGPHCTKCEMTWCWFCVNPDSIEECSGE